jgi:hypothetical protein
LAQTIQFVVGIVGSGIKRAPMEVTRVVEDAGCHCQMHLTRNSLTSTRINTSIQTIAARWQHCAPYLELILR